MIRFVVEARRKNTCFYLQLKLFSSLLVAPPCIRFGGIRERRRFTPPVGPVERGRRR